MESRQLHPHSQPQGLALIRRVGRAWARPARPRARVPPRLRVRAISAGQEGLSRKRSLLVTLACSRARRVGDAADRVDRVTQRTVTDNGRCPQDCVRLGAGLSSSVRRHESRRGARHCVNSKGRIVVLNHPGRRRGPIGNTTTQLLEFDSTGKFVREIGKGVYGLGYAHAVRFDKSNNLWVVDKGTNFVMKFNPAGSRKSGPRRAGGTGYEPSGSPSTESPPKRESRPASPPTHGFTRAPTDVGWDATTTSTSVTATCNSRIREVRQARQLGQVEGTIGTSGEHATKIPATSDTPHNLSVNRQRLRLCRQSRQPANPGIRRRRHLHAVHPPHRPLQQEAPAGARFGQSEWSGRDAAVDDLHPTDRRQIFYSSDSEPGPDLQADPGRRDSPAAGRVRTRGSDSSTGRTASRVRRTTCCGSRI